MGVFLLTWLVLRALSCCYSMKFSRPNKPDYLSFTTQNTISHSGCMNHNCITEQLLVMSQLHTEHSSVHCRVLTHPHAHACQTVCVGGSSPRESGLQPTAKPAPLFIMFLSGSLRANKVNSTLHLGLALWLYPDEPPRADPRLLVCVILLGKLHTPRFHATGDELDVSTEWSNIVYLGCEVPVTEITTD